LQEGFSWGRETKGVELFSARGIFLREREEIAMAEMTDVRCEDCGAVFPMIVGQTERKEDHAWFPGRKCPICASEKFFPVVKTDKGEEKPLSKWKVDRRVGIAAGVTIVVFLLIGVIWYFHERPHRQAGRKALYICGVCGERFVSGVAGRVPKKCPKCKSWEGYRAVQCLSCYHVYLWKAKDWAVDPPICPKCKSKVSKILNDFSDIEKKKLPEERGEGDRENETSEK
jgi:Zn finger protein HypA/HybF involved in hydrogenase expression